ncbi:hypothetical protein CRE_05629 [Caenorhabditis remanei]|uniref:CUB-like domain-containing protein n=1 Tax=Caenorhabditis remanei TaxID=31234 RepID=E3M0D2_CAERE|nr:hypothetical protein CRE_05629 [Caenorhabditis remanei]
MLKLALLLLCVVVSAQALAFTCPSARITPANPAGNVPSAATNLTDVANGTNCSIAFDIPNNYALLLKLSGQSGSENDTVIVFGDSNKNGFELTQSSIPVYDVPLWMPAQSGAQVQVVGVSNYSKFFLTYMYQPLNNYKQVTKKTGEYFQLNTIDVNTFVTITATSSADKVIATAGYKNTIVDPSTTNYFVYDGDNINTAKVMGRLSEFGPAIKISSGKSVSIVTFDTKKSDLYAIGNDASTLDGYGTYRVLVTSVGYIIGGTMTDLTGTANGAATTFICTDCSTFYWTQINFDNFSNKGFVTFQGQTPTHKREKLIKYEAMTFTNNQLPQILPTDIFTISVYFTRAGFNVTTSNSSAANWKKAYIGRKGYIFSPSLWTSNSAANNFNYEFRDDSQLYNFTLNMNKMSFPASNDQMTLKIGSGTGNLTVNNLYPRDQSSNGIVMSNGNYMQIGLAASAGADIRLSFEMQKPKSSVSIVGFLSAIAFTFFYNL